MGTVANLFAPAKGIARSVDEIVEPRAGAIKT